MSEQTFTEQARHDAGWPLVRVPDLRAAIWLMVRLRHSRARWPVGSFSYQEHTDGFLVVFYGEQPEIGVRYQRTLIQDQLSRDQVIDALAHWRGLGADRFSLDFIEVADDHYQIIQHYAEVGRRVKPLLCS